MNRGFFSKNIIPIFIGIFKYFLLYDNNKKIKVGKKMLSYEPLWETMEKKDVSTYALIYKHDIPSKTIYNLKHNKSITMYTLERLCKILNCTPNDVVKFIYDKEDPNQNEETGRMQ